VQRYRCSYLHAAILTSCCDYSPYFVAVPDRCTRRPVLVST
jgi:hypothetical protein